MRYFPVIQTTLIFICYRCYWLTIFIYDWPKAGDLVKQLRKMDFENHRLETQVKKCRYVCYLFQKEKENAALV